VNRAKRLRGRSEAPSGETEIHSGEVHAREVRLLEVRHHPHVPSLLEQEDGEDLAAHLHSAEEAGHPEIHVHHDGGIGGDDGDLHRQCGRRRDWRRRRAPIVSEAEFLARREAVKREMVVRQHVGATVEDNYTQIAVLEDNVLVEHYVARESQTSLIGNVYLGKVQNVLPSMEAAFIDIGAGRNAVLYAGEVDWSTLGEGKARKIEDALQPGQSVLVQVSKDPIGQKGARLTSQISIPGRFLVYVPRGQVNGISRKLPENERARLKTLLREVLPEYAGVIVR
jgi:hypothetical protein